MATIKKSMHRMAAWRPIDWVAFTLGIALLGFIVASLAFDNGISNLADRYESQPSGEEPGQQPPGPGNVSGLIGQF